MLLLVKSVRQDTGGGMAGEEEITCLSACVTFWFSFLVASDSGYEYFPKATKWSNQVFYECFFTCGAQGPLHTSTVREAVRECIHDSCQSLFKQVYREGETFVKIRLLFDIFVTLIQVFRSYLLSTVLCYGILFSLCGYISFWRDALSVFVFPFVVFLFTSMFKVSFIWDCLEPACLEDFVLGRVSLTLVSGIWAVSNRFVERFVSMSLDTH